MRKLLIILASVLAAAILLVVLQLVGIYSQRAYAATLVVAGVALIAFRGTVAAWIRARSAASPLTGHWRATRPVAVVLCGLGFIALAVATLINGKL